MNLNLAESIKLVKKIKRSVRSNKKLEIAICPSFTALKSIKLVAPKIKLGAQNVFWESKGAFTGEISLPMLEEVGCSYVIIGHSERRRFLNETDEMVNKRLLTVFRSKIIPIICLGETWEQRRKGKERIVVSRQLEKIFKNVKIRSAQKVIIVYEPVWAIGTGRPCFPHDAVIMHRFIKKILLKKFPASIVKNNFRIIYGGSVNSKIVADYLKHPEIQGCLVGGASVNAEEFIKIIKLASNYY